MLNRISICPLEKQSCGFYEEELNECGYCHKYGEFVRICGGFKPVPESYIKETEELLGKVQHICEVSIDNEIEISRSGVIKIESAIGRARYCINHLIAERKNNEENETGMETKKRKAD